MSTCGGRVFLENRTASLGRLHGWRTLFSKSHDHGTASIRWPRDVWNILWLLCCHLTAVVRFPGTQDRVKSVCHFAAITRPPYDNSTVTLQCYELAAALRCPYNCLTCPCGDGTVSLPSPHGIWVVRLPCGRRNICDDNCRSPQVRGIFKNTICRP